jgi:hypothetical protein
MVGDPRDRTAYAIAIAGLGFALALLIVGICWIAVEHSNSTELLTRRCPLLNAIQCRPAIHIDSASEGSGVPPGLWVAVAALSGVLVGALIPSPLWLKANEVVPRDVDRAWHYLTVGVFVLLGVVAVLIALIFGTPSLSAYAVLASAAGILLGLPIPSPGRGES